MHNSAYSLIQHLADAIFLNHDSDQKYFAIMSAYTVYFDASGDKGNEMLAVGGFIASVEEWKHFQDEWQEALQMAGVTHFHRKKFTAKRPPFDDPKWHDENFRSVFMKELIEIIVKNVRFQILNLLRIDDWNTANREYRLREAKMTPFALSGCTAIEAAYVWARQHDIPKAHLEFFFEDGDDNCADLIHHCKKLYGFTPGFKPKEPNDMFPDIKELNPLQAGDLVAGYSRAAEIAITKSGIDPAEYNITKCLEALISRVPAHENSEMFTLEGLRALCEREKIMKR